MTHVQTDSDNYPYSTLFRSEDAEDHGVLYKMLATFDTVCNDLGLTGRLLQTSTTPIQSNASVFTCVAKHLFSDSDLAMMTDKECRDGFIKPLLSIAREEDRILRDLLNKAVAGGGRHYQGSTTPEILFQAKSEFPKDVAPTQIVIAFDRLCDILNVAFKPHFTPSMQIEMIRAGNIGTLCGLNVITDGGHENASLAGDVFVLSAPKDLGVIYREPITAEFITEDVGGIIKRGWVFKRTLAMTIHAEGVARVTRKEVQEN